MQNPRCCIRCGRPVAMFYLRLLSHLPCGPPFHSLMRLLTNNGQQRHGSSKIVCYYFRGGSSKKEISVG
eukprot:4987412-Alexandrium_andersonii.AAC.1